jgi:hypothetical protein
MHDDLEKKRHEADRIQEELNGEGLSRRGFMDRLRILGIGFGAAFLLGVKNADAHSESESSASLNSSNPVLDSIIKGGREEPSQEAAGPEDDTVETAYYRRYFRRAYARGYHGGGYGGGYRRAYVRAYRRAYRRY